MFEVIAILLSPDTLLNGKNEYIHIFIVEEDTKARRKGLLEVEAEEKLHEENVEEFKEIKTGKSCHVKRF